MSMQQVIAFIFRIPVHLEITSSQKSYDDIITDMQTFFLSTID